MSGTWLDDVKRYAADAAAHYITISFIVRDPEPQFVRGYRSLKDADFPLHERMVCYVCAQPPDAYLETGTADPSGRATWKYHVLLCFRCIRSWGLMKANAEASPAPEIPDPNPYGP